MDRGFPMIEGIVEMVSRMPETIVIGFCVFLLASVIMIFGLQFILKEINKINQNLSDMKEQLQELRYIADVLDGTAHTRKVTHKLTAIKKQARGDRKIKED